MARIDDLQEAPIEDVVALLVRERITGQAPPPSARRVVDALRADLESQCGATLDRFAAQLGNQSAFAQVTRQLISDLDFADELGQDPDAAEASAETAPEDSEETDPQDMASDSEHADGPQGDDVEAPSVEDAGDDTQSSESETEDLAGTSDTDEVTDDNKPWRPDEFKGENIRES